MNLYFLVEGRRTEWKVYPYWIEQLLPGFTRIRSSLSATDRSYFLISGKGYPSLLTHLENSINDCNLSGQYDYLVVCLDADELSTEDRIREVEGYLSRKNIALRSGELRIVVQNRTFETWLLGNRRIVSGNSQDHELPAFLQFYDVRSADPERMGIYPGFRLHSQFHEAYLKAIFRSRSIRYTKQHPGHVCEETYLQELVTRVRTQPEHLASFQTLLSFCSEVLDDSATS